MWSNEEYDEAIRHIALWICTVLGTVPACGVLIGSVFHSLIVMAWTPCEPDLDPYVTAMLR